MIAVTRITLTAAFACACAAHAQGPVPREQVFAWGDKQWGQCEILPRGREFVQVAAGACHTIALRADGTIFGTLTFPRC
jgi:alpha-tubulin suppressor-like RCC1 family protein